jgi:adenylate cyclase
MAAGSHSFLFTDLVGFTALTAAEGDDRAAEVACDFYDRVRPLLAPHGAEEIKTIGDALMLRCDEPADAMRLGVAIVSELESDPSFPLVRVGIHTGPAVHHNGDWYGTTVNVAARLCAAAAGGQVLASETTRERAGRVRGLEFGEERLHWLKNVSDPVGAQLVTAHECRLASRSFSLRDLFGVRELTV